jgi:hypothetical protein
MSVNGHTVGVRWEPALRVSDEERERVAEFLRAAWMAGRLDPDELSDRLGRAYGATTRGELWPPVADLPDGNTAVPWSAALPTPRRAGLAWPRMARWTLIAVAAVIVMTAVPAAVGLGVGLIVLTLALIGGAAFSLGPLALLVVALVWLARQLRPRPAAHFPPA